MECTEKGRPGSQHLVHQLRSGTVKTFITSAADPLKNNLDLDILIRNGYRLMRP